MYPSEKFRHFAAECQAMAKFARSTESKVTWDCLAARWFRCAELAEQHSFAPTLERKRHRRSSRGGSHLGNAEAA
jgi:hypothetical protein